MFARSKYWESSVSDQERFARKNFKADDVLIVSLGSNDIAYSFHRDNEPNEVPATAKHEHERDALAQKNRSGVADLFDEADDAEFERLVTSAAHPAMQRLIEYYKDGVTAYLTDLLEGVDAANLPRKILVCMIYFPAEKHSHSWARNALDAMHYTKNPERLQLVIRTLFVKATSAIKLAEQFQKKIAYLTTEIQKKDAEINTMQTDLRQSAFGNLFEEESEELKTAVAKQKELADKRLQCETLLRASEHFKDVAIVPVPLFEVMDGKDPELYVSQVEPSAKGGRKMAEEFARILYHSE